MKKNHTRLLFITRNQISLILIALLFCSIITSAAIRQPVIPQPNQPLNSPPNKPDNPSPTNEAVNISISTQFYWEGSDPDPSDNITYDVYFENNTPPTLLIASLNESTFNPGTLQYNTTYYWKVIANDSEDTTEGDLWSFTTEKEPNQPPYEPFCLNPLPGEMNTDLDEILIWIGGDPDADIVFYDIYLGTTTTPPLVASDVLLSLYIPETLEYNTTYFWKIIADDGQSTTESQVWNFTTKPQPNNPPNEPCNPTPEDAAFNISIHTTLDWTCNDQDNDTVSFNLVYDTTSPPTQYEIDGLTTSSYNPGVLFYNTTYYWTITAIDEHQAQTQGPIWSFTTEQQPNNPPYIPNNPHPSDHETNVSIHSTLSWTGGDSDLNDTVTYDVYFGRDFGGIVIYTKISANQSDTFIQLDSLDYNTTYQWMIVAWDDHHSYTGSDWWYFTTEQEPNTPPAAPSNPIPNDNQTNISVQTNLNWTCSDPDSNDTLTYDIYFGTIYSQEKIASNQTTPSYDLPHLLYGKQYYWRIIAWDNHHTSTNGPLWTFTTQSDTQAPIVEITSPGKGFLYINLRDIIVMKIPFISTIVLGKIDVTIDATDSQSGVNKVEFYIDDELQSTDTTAPFTWSWTERGLFLPYTIKVTAYDNAGNTQSDQIKLWKIF
jgi:hypothetical protein